MPYASFEPVLVIATLHCSVCILELIKFLLVAKNMKKKKDTHQVPKQRIPHCLGLFWLLPPSITLPIAYFVNKILRNRKNSPRAQTMPEVLFGPVFIVLPSPTSSSIDHVAVLLPVLVCWNC